jgi:putrescine---pyruvate transaminase
MSPPAFLHPFSKPASERFVTIVRGRGALVWDADGHEYVDALASLWYCNIGHGRPEIAEAVADQMRRLAAFHTFELFSNEPADQLCEQVAALAPFPDARVFLTSSGSEAVDTAIKLARFGHAVSGAVERTIVISRRPSYHGVTYGGVSATGLPANQAHFGPLLPDVVQVPHDDLAATAAVFDEHPGRVAAVLAEPVIGAGGVYPPAPGYLDGLRRLCDEHGAWLILDEVICGFGRLGTWWGAQRYGVTPDLVTFAKAVTSGYQPLGGVLVGLPVREAIEADPDLVLRHGHTYSGHPVAAAAGIANLAILEGEALADRVPRIGQRLERELRALLSDGLVSDVRGDGAVWGVSMPDGVSAPVVRDGMLSRGVIARPIGETTIAFCPPLVIEDRELDRCVEALADALVAVRGGRAAQVG